MNESLEIIVEMIAIVSFVAGVVNYTIIKPLKIAIDTLTHAVEKLEHLLHQVEEDERKLRERVRVNEVKIGNLEDEIESLKGYHKP